MKRREVSIIYLSLAVVWLYIVRPPMALAEGSPAVVIDKTNWEEIEGLVPDSVLGWVKSGAFVLTLDELNFQPLDYLPAFATETLESNVGEYDLDEDGGIVEVMTGKPPKHIVGLPFPQVDENEPDLSVRIMYNTGRGRPKGAFDRHRRRQPEEHMELLRGSGCERLFPGRLSEVQ
jgi:hypothetical protein